MQNQTKLYLAAPTCAALTTDMTPIYSKQGLIDIIGAVVDDARRIVPTLAVKVHRLNYIELTLKQPLN